MPDVRRKPPKSYRSIIFWIAAGIIIIVLYSLLQTPGAIKREINFSEFMDEVERGNINEVTITGSQLKGKFTDGQAFKSVAPTQYDDLVKILREHNIIITVKDTSRSPWFSYLFTWFPILLLILFWVFFMRQMQAGGNKALSFGKSRAKLFSGVQKKVTFKDVAGVEMQNWHALCKSAWDQPVSWNINFSWLMI